MSIARRLSRYRAPAATLLAAALVASLAACGGDDDSGGGGGGGDDTLTVWIIEDLPDRVAATQEIVDAFSEESGVTVELTPVAEDQFAQILTSNAAAGDLPDVIGGIPLGQVRTLSANELLDTDATADVLEALDPATFSESALALTADGDTQLAIPSESWIQLLVYRKDLFEAAGLAEPTTYDDILAAAEALDSPDLAGFVGANIAGDAFTAQTMEEIGLGNDCQLVDEEGEVTFDSDQCVEALDFYGQLMQNYTVSGAQDVDTTRASYFAGQAAMIIWSTFILDEMAGLRNDALPTCPECKKDPGFLAKNSGVVTAIQGPSGSDAGDVRRGHLVGDRGRAGRPGRGVRRVRDDRRLRAVDRHRPRGQGAGALRPRVGIDRVLRRVGLDGRRRRHQGAALGVLRPGRHRRAHRRHRHPLPLGDLAGPGRPARRHPGRAAGGQRGQRGQQRHRPGRGRLAGRRRHP